MANIWSRNKIWGASTFDTDVNVADGTNNASVVPATSYLGLKLSTEVDPEGRNRTKWFTSIIGQLLRAVLHIDENRATGSNIGVSGTGIESTQTVYTTPEQLPEVDKTTNDFSTPAKSDSNGVLTTANDLFNVSTVTTDRKNKKFIIKFSDVGVLFFKARTWLESELVALITDTADPLITAAIEAAERIAPITQQLVVATTNTLTSTSYVDLSSVTYTTPNDGVTRKYLITFKATYFLEVAATETARTTLKLYNNTDNTTFDESTVFLNSGSIGDVIDVEGVVYLQTIQEILPNKVIRVAGKRVIASSYSNTIKDSSLLISEIK